MIKRPKEMKVAGARIETFVFESVADSALDIIPGPAAVADPQGRIIKANAPLAELLGRRPGELFGEEISTLLRGGRAAAMAIEKKLSATGQVSDLETELAASGGRAVKATISAMEIYDGYSGEPLFRLFLFRDMRPCSDVIEELRATKEELSRRVQYLEEFRSGVFEMLRDLDRSESEIKAAYRKLRETQAQLVESSRLKALGELSAVLAHELRQPVTVVKGLAQNLLEGRRLGGAEAKKIRMILDATVNMESLIRHLGLFSRAEVPAFTAIDLNEVVRSAFGFLSPVMKKGGVKVRIHAGDIPMIKGSATRLEELIINLAINARDAMPDGGLLEIKTRRSDGRTVELLVRDTGPGMTEDVKKRIFEPFFTTKPPEKGTGLGLSVSYSIVREHGGMIDVESSPGRGTTFRIRLPAFVGEEVTSC